MVKNLPAMQETRVQSLGPEEHLEKGIAMHSSILGYSLDVLLFLFGTSLVPCPVLTVAS